MVLDLFFGTPKEEIEDIPEGEKDSATSGSWQARYLSKKGSLLRSRQGLLERMDSVEEAMQRIDARIKSQEPILRKVLKQIEKTSSCSDFDVGSPGPTADLPTYAGEEISDGQKFQNATPKGNYWMMITPAAP